MLGLAGLMGSGRTELARALFGIDPLDSGELLLSGSASASADPARAIAPGIALVPEDRRVQGLMLDHSVGRQHHPAHARPPQPRGGFVDDAEGARATERRRAAEHHARARQTAVRRLSGGNQQKVVIAKWLGTEPRILIMDEPTAGVDIGTKGEIVEHDPRLRRRRAGVIIISSELPELLAVSDRILILRDGTVDRELDRSEIARRGGPPPRHPGARMTAVDD